MHRAPRAEEAAPARCSAARAPAARRRISHAHAAAAAAARSCRPPGRDAELSGPRRASERTSRGGDSRWPRPRPARHAGKRAGPALAPPPRSRGAPAAAGLRRTWEALPAHPSPRPGGFPGRRTDLASGPRRSPGPGVRCCTRRPELSPGARAASHSLAASPDRACACGGNAEARSPLHVYRGRQSSSRPSRGQRLCTARASVSNSAVGTDMSTAQLQRRPTHDRLLAAASPSSYVEANALLCIIPLVATSAYVSKASLSSRTRVASGPMVHRLHASWGSGVTAICSLEETRLMTTWPAACVTDRGPSQP